MQRRKQTNIWKMIFAGLVLSAFLVQLQAQHRGDNLRFQGLDLINRNGVRATAMGGAFTAASGELDALFWNPAGLAGISGIQFTANYASADALWRENQDYRPNRQLVTMSFILDGLYMPNPDFNGWIDSEAFLEDSTYSVNEPVLGQESYSEEAADWQEEMENTGLNNIAAALPLKIGERSLVLSAGYSQRLNVMNYDRNHTHLSPHPAFDGYADLPGRVTGASDSVRVIWSDFTRQRSGPLKTFTAAAGFGLSDNVHFGLRYSSLSGETQDAQTLDRIGNFDLVEGIQIFRFSYDTLDVALSGTSDFSASSITLGSLVKLGKLTIGGSLTPGHTLTREWSYQVSMTSPDSSSSESLSGEDTQDIPLSYTIGVNLQPHDKFSIAFDLEHRPFSKGEVTLASEDATFRSWADQTSFRLGAEFKVVENLSLLGGYRNIPQVFIPDGAADTQRGPELEAYTLGASLSFLFARIDAAYDIATLRYYDVYFSNTNFAYQRTNNLRLGITLTY